MRFLFHTLSLVGMAGFFCIDCDESCFVVPSDVNIAVPLDVNSKERVYFFNSCWYLYASFF